MILLRPDCLVFKTSDGESVPCSAQQIMVELIGDAANWLDKEIIVNASEAVLHYFKQEKHQDTVSVGEFVEALEKVLRGLGLNVKAASPVAAPTPLAVASAVTAAAAADPRPVVETDLRDLATVSGGGAELFFFPILRDEIHRHLGGSPQVLLFRGLRGCVKLLVGSKRWTHSCQDLNDQIVEYLRTCLNREKGGEGCALVVM